ncbi:MAG: ATP phosphoribosyltransferase regulatory subunit [Clostridia bacterium]|nr:ATP phosphoribosyltransferase regulatory subunit [Clostridia bacterium]
MNFTEGILKNDEYAIYKLRELYRQYGYSHYKVSKFEEYDLYARNKSFLISENILTFTDTNGKLMALKPDVTLSIVKNVSGNELATNKLYYNETVYRTSAGSDGFREIMQTGLECIGTLDIYAVCEVIMLAQKSLSLISNDYILDISHMGFLTGLLENAGIPKEDVKVMLSRIANKNKSEILAYCAAHSTSAEATEAICAVTDLYAPLKEALPKIQALVCGKKMQKAYEQLCEIQSMLKLYGNEKRIYLDFSMIHDMSYYNDIIFRGFLNGIPESVLSGGRYDSLLEKMGKKANAIGFAVYLDRLEYLPTAQDAFDFDVLLTYDDSVSTDRIVKTVEALRAEGKRVRVQQHEADTLRCRTCLHLSGQETEDKDQ